MSQDSGVLPAVRSLAIFIAFASALYFLLVWNPVGSLGDLRNYFEHRVRVPVEWIVLLFPIAWVIQHKHGYTVAAVVLLPIFVLILTFTRPDYGVEFWRIFRNEVYLDPIYVPRGLLVCFFLLSLVVYPRKDLDKARTFLLCLIIGFALTSWEALIAPSPPHEFEGGGWFVGPLTDGIHAVWRPISWHIARYVPPDYQNATRVGLSVSPLLAFFLLLFPSYRQVPKEFVRVHREDFPMYLFVGVLVGLSGWAFWAATRGRALGGGAKFMLAILSIPAVVAMIALFLSSIVWVPAGLFVLPAFLFWVISQPFKVVYFLVVKAPFMVWHYLHYLTVPHPAETAYRAGMAEHVSIPELARTVADAMYRYDLKDFDGLPKAWKSKNWTKRIDAFHDRLQAEDRFMEELIQNLRLKSQFRE